MIRLLALGGLAVWRCARRRRAAGWSSRGEDGAEVGWPRRAEPAGCSRLRIERPMTAVDDLGRRLVEVALLEGDFLLRRASGRAGTSTSTASRPTRPARPLGERLATAAREVEPDAVRLAGPALGAVALAASAAMASGVPFIIVRGETKEYGTANRIEGPYGPGDVVCLLEDVVTSGGALLEAVEALREAGLVVRHAVCVVDREEGGADALARGGCGSPRSTGRPTCSPSVSRGDQRG